MPDKTEATEAATTVAEPSPSEQALQVVDRAVGTVPVVADAVRKTVEDWSDPAYRSKELKTLEDRGADVRRQVTDQVVEMARKARERFEPTAHEADQSN